jgi:hypothetical protein
MPDGSWSGFEIKLGAHQIDAAAEGLKRISAKFERPPTSLCVICGLSNAAYTREDGVIVAPMTALRPKFPLLFSIVCSQLIFIWIPWANRYPSVYWFMKYGISIL